MVSLRTTRRSAAWRARSRVFDAEIRRAAAGHEPRFPAYSHFFPSDLVTDEDIRACHEQGQAVVIVDEHEHVTVLPAPDPSIAERESDRFWSEIRAQR
ncbi:MAG TPA: hypothetical protein VF250_04050 [Conexibacter sp.]